MNLNNIKLAIEDPRLTNGVHSLNKVLIMTISVIIIAIFIKIIIDKIESSSEYRKASIIAVIITILVLGLEYQGLNLYFKQEVTKYQIQLISNQTREILKVKDIKKDQCDYIKRIKIKDALGEKVNQEDLNKIKDMIKN